MLVFVALGIVEQSARRQAKHADHLQERKTTAAFLFPRLRVRALIFRGVGQADAGAVDDFDAEFLPELAGLLGVRRHGTTQTGQDIERQPVARLAISTGPLANPTRTHQSEERLDLAHDFAAGASGIEHLVEKAKEGAAERVNLLAAVRAFLGLGQEPSGQERAKEKV